MNLVEFLDGFARPLVAGGDARVGDPLDVRTVVEWEIYLSEAAEALMAIDSARETVASGLVIRPPAMPFGGDELRLCAALYDALLLVHPDVDRWLARRAKDRVRDAALELARLPAPDGRRDLLSRHTTFHNLFGLSRIDVRIRWWTGKAAFRGMRPPSRLVAWPSIRRVTEERESMSFSEIMPKEGDDGAVGRALIHASPLTDLLAPARSWPEFEWRPEVVAILADPELARAVAYHWLSAPNIARLHPPAAAAAAWERMLVRKKVPPADVRTVTAFLVHVASLYALAETGMADLDAPSGLFTDGGPAAALFLALPDVAVIADPALAAPPGLEEDPRLARRWRSHRKQARGPETQARNLALAEKLGAALGC